MEKSKKEEKKDSLDDYSDFDKGLYFYDGNNFNMALFYFNLYKKSKNIKEEDNVEEFISRCKEGLEEKNNKLKDFKENRYSKILEDEIQKLLEISNPNELFQVSPYSSEKEITNAYKKLISQYHPDVNDNPKAFEAFNKISKAYIEILSKKSKNHIEQNAYKLFVENFKDISINALLNDERYRYNFRKNGPQSAPGYWFIPIIRISILLAVVYYFVFPYFYKNESLFSFVKSDENPYEKITHKHKIKYYIGNEFKEKYPTKKEVKTIEKEIEQKYLEYLKVSCDAKNEEKDKLYKRLVYYRNTSTFYKEIFDDIDKVNLTICDQYKHYNKTLNKTEVIKNDTIHDDINIDENNTNKTQ